MTIAEPRASLHPAPDISDLVDTARRLVPVLRAHAARNESERRLSGETIAALTDSGMFKLLVPKRFGGYQVPLRNFLDITATLAEGEGAASWLAAVCNSCAWMASLFPERAQHDVFGAGRDVIVSGVTAPTATAVRVYGGFRVSGRWHYNSGSWHADWAVLGIPLVDSDGTVVDSALALVPAADYTVEDTWFMAGMAATGSNCLVAEDVFIPEHRVMALAPVLGGSYPTEHTDEVLYRSAFGPFVATVIVGPLLGLGRAALDLVTAKAAEKSIAFTVYEKQRDSTAFQVAVADAALKIDTAHLHAYRAAEVVDESAAGAIFPELPLRARVRADLGHVVENVVEAINTLLYIHGSSSFAAGNDLQRIWRDANVGARHAVVQPLIGKEIYGKALLGVDEQVSPLL
ncbi:oxidoreductase [Nocardia terpenica]|uniref:oxidoreductase n=1 Tax=Nocardia terpenica TaxID=455432 RepID=UPI00031CBA9F|nr:oxidoreductase [Nocardia terpenica]NQE93058.1 oxidoreductase [Nocardia terpenica]